MQLKKNLRKEGSEVSCNKIIRLMDKLGLQVKQRIAYKVTTMHKHSHSVADNIVDQHLTQSRPIKSGLAM
jgi:putative transposase